MKKIIKKIYSRLPFKKKIFSILKPLISSKKVYQHLHFVSNFKVKVDNQRNFMIRHYGYEIENEIFWNGINNGWEKVSLKLWEELCEKSNVIFDIGANTGVYSLLAKTINPKSDVHAFEPVKRVFEKLEYNCHLNKYNIHCEEIALSNFTGTAIIYDKDTEHTYSVTVNKDTSIKQENSIEVTINTQRLDEYIELKNIKKVDLLKIDVETHEPEVIDGFGKYLKKYEPSFIIEILNDEIAEKIEKKIKSIDYFYYVIDENSGIKKVSSLRKSDYYNFLICKPEIAESLNSVKYFEKKYK